MSIKKCIAMWLGVLYDSQATNRKQGGLSVRAALCTTWHSYWSQAGKNKDTATNKWKLLLFD
jgi:hypothetical protein